jgi:predicted O-methyltransferase YrrM
MWRYVILTLAANDCSDKKQFDFIYIDGNHCCDNVLADAVMSWTMLKPGGIMLFDDYLYEDLPDVLDRGKIAIDAFCTCLQDK